MVQANRIDEITAGRVALGKEFLRISQRDPRFGCHLARAEIWICKAVVDDAADTGKQLVRVRNSDLPLFLADLDGAVGLVDDDRLASPQNNP